MVGDPQRSRRAALVGTHDACNRSHKWFTPAGVKCQVRGRKQCGLWAWFYGRPKEEWTLRLYNLRGEPITGRIWDGGPMEIGSCSWSGGHPTWREPPSFAEEYPCLSDGELHGGDH